MAKPVAIRRVIPFIALVLYHGLSRHAQRSPIGPSSVSDAASEGISLIEGERLQRRHPFEVLPLAVNIPQWDGHRKAPSGSASLFVKLKANPVNHLGSPDPKEEKERRYPMLPRYDCITLAQAEVVSTNRDNVIFWTPHVEVGGYLAHKLASEMGESALSLLRSANTRSL